MAYRHVIIAALWILFVAPPAFAQEPAPASAGAVTPAADADAGVVLPPPAVSLSLSGAEAQPGAAPARQRRRPTKVGYIDDATVGSQLRFRFDAGTGNNAPDRAEFFYAKCGCYQLDPPPFFDPEAPGPGPGVPTELNFQQFYAYVEGGVSGRFSIFGELPIRMIQPQGFLDFGPAYAPWDDASGLADIRFGVKGALHASDDAGATFQVRFSSPSGDAGKGLGSNLWSIEPALLYHQNLGARAGLEAQFGVWLPMGGSAGVEGEDNFSGNVLFYGIGPSFDAVDTGNVQFSPVVELIGWRVLNGNHTLCDPATATCVFDAAGVNIVNLKVGARTTVSNRNSFYVGFGWGLTDQVWYDKLFRVEFRRGF